MHLDQLERGRVAEAHRQFGGADYVGEHDGAQPGMHSGNRGALGCFGIADAAKKRLHHRKIDGNDVVGHLAVGLAMDPLSRRGVGRLNQAEIGAARAVEPVSQVLDPVPVLDLQVLAMCLGDALGCHAAHVVAIHEDRQAALL